MSVQVVGVLAGEAHQGSGVHPPAEHGQQLERPLGGVVELPQATRHPLGEPFGDTAQGRRCRFAPSSSSARRSPMA